MKTLLLLLATAVLLVGCATPLQPDQARVRFESEPRGASLSDSHGSLGTTPSTYVWTFNIARRTLYTTVTATWKSGVTVEQDIYLFKGDDKTIIFKMPEGAVQKLACQKYGFKEETDSFAACYQREVLAAKAAAEAADAQPSPITDAFYNQMWRNILSPSSSRSEPEPDVRPYGVVPPKVSSMNKQTSSQVYQTRDSFGNLVNSNSSFQTKDSNGNFVNSQSNFQTRDSNGNLVRSGDCFQTKDSFGNLVRSAGCQ